MITKQDFDKATEQEWSERSCLIAQMIMRETGLEILSARITSIMTLTGSIGRFLAEPERRLQTFFDENYLILCRGRSIYYSEEDFAEAESNLFFLRAFLPLEDKDI